MGRVLDGRWIRSPGPLPRLFGLLLIAGVALGCPRQTSSGKKYEAPDERFILFAPARVDFASDGYFTVGYVAALLDAEPSYHVLIVGHADQAGKSEATRDLGFKRARAVRKALIDHGIKEGRILIAAPHEEGGTISSLGRRADIFVYDPVQDEASRRLGYPVEIRSE
jgi:OmpA family